MPNQDNFDCYNTKDHLEPPNYNDQIHRLLNSLYKLYTEFSHIIYLVELKHLNLTFTI